MKKYESYKEVDLPWLNEIPNHWKLVRLGGICNIINGFTPNRSNKDFWNNGTIPWFTIADVRNQGRFINYTEQSITEHAIRKNYYRIIPKDSVLLCCTASVGEFAYTNIPLVTNQQFNGLVLKEEFKKEIYPLFLYNFVATFKKILLFQAGKTTISFIPVKSLSEIVIPIPPLEEQKKIADYLDWKINEIDKLISIEKEKVKEVNLYKDSAIYKLVRYGSFVYDKKNKILNNCVFKTCPIDWEIGFIKRFVSENKVKNNNLVEKNLLSLSYGKLKRKSLNATGLVPKNFEGYQIIDKGMIILRFTDLQNDHKSLRVGLCKERGIITSAYVGLKVKDNKIYPEFLYYYLHAYDVNKGFYGMGTGVRQSLSYSEFAKMEIAFPELNKQKKIANKCEILEEYCDKVINTFREKIILLESLKQSLISEVVTGKIDVRDVVIPKYEKAKANDNEEINEMESVEIGN